MQLLKEDAGQHFGFLKSYSRQRVPGHVKLISHFTVRSVRAARPELQVEPAGKDPGGKGPRQAMGRRPACGQVSATCAFPSTPVPRGLVEGEEQTRKCASHGCTPCVCHTFFFLVGDGLSNDVRAPPRHRTGEVSVS